LIEIEPTGHLKPYVQIALLSRRLSLLAERPEFRAADIAARIDATLDANRAVPLSWIEKVLIRAATPLDLISAAGLCELKRTTPARRAVLLSVLGNGGRDYVAAMYWALPAEARRACLVDRVWSDAAGVGGDLMGEGLEWVEDLVLGCRDWAHRRTAAPPELLDEANRLDRETSRYRAGLPHDLSDEEIEELGEDRELMAGALAQVRQDAAE
jgi:hypothetical protein